MSTRVAILLVFVLSVCAWADAPDDGDDLRRCKSNLRQIGISMVVYVDNFGEGRFYPQELCELIAPGRRLLTDPRCYICPADTKPTRKLLDDLKTSYEYFGEMLKTRIADSTPSDLMMVWERKGNHPGGRNCLFLDGHVEFLAEDRFQETLAGQKKEYKGQLKLRAVEDLPAISDDEAKRVEELIAGLGREEFAERKKAAGELRGMGAKAARGLLKHVRDADPEVRMSVRELLDEMDIDPSQITETAAETPAAAAGGAPADR